MLLGLLLLVNRFFSAVGVYSFKTVLETGTNFRLGLKLGPIFDWAYNSDQFLIGLETRTNF